MSAFPVTKVFLVDVFPLVREGVRRRVEREGAFEVVGEAATAAEALDALERMAVDILVVSAGACDALDDDRVACLARMVSRAAVVMLSHEGDARDVSHALRAGARGYVLKRSPAERVVEAIRAVAGGGTFLDDGLVHQVLGQEEQAEVLTRREREVLLLVGQGSASKTIARQLGISVRTVESHRQSLKRKLQVDGQAALIKYAVEHAASRAAAMRGN